MDGQVSSICQTSFHKVSDLIFIFLWGQNLLPALDSDILPDPPVSDTLCHNAVTYCLQIQSASKTHTNWIFRYILALNWHHHVAVHINMQSLWQLSSSKGLKLEANTTKCCFHTGLLLCLLCLSSCSEIYVFSNPMAEIPEGFEEHKKHRTDWTVWWKGDMQCTAAGFLEPLVSLDWQLVRSVPQADFPLKHNCLLKQKQRWLGSLCESVNFCFPIFYFPQLSSGFPVLSESTPLVQIAVYFNLPSHNSCNVGTVSLYTSNFSDMLHLGHL